MLFSKRCLHSEFQMLRFRLRNFREEDLTRVVSFKLERDALWRSIRDCWIQQYPTCRCSLVRKAKQRFLNEFLMNINRCFYSSISRCSMASKVSDSKLSNENVRMKTFVRPEDCWNRNSRASTGNSLSVMTLGLSGMTPHLARSF